MLRCELLTAQVSSKTIDAPRDMAEVKTNWSESLRPGPDLCVGEIIRPARKIFTYLRKSM